MSETTKNKNKSASAQNHGHGGRPRKNTKTIPNKGGRNSGEFRIGSRDILESPEILSPFGFEENTPPKGKRGKKADAPVEASISICTSEFSSLTDSKPLALKNV